MSVIYEGQFALDHPLTPEHRTYLERFSETRHVQWHVKQIADLDDPVREAAGLQLGPEGAYFTGIKDCSPRQQARYPIPYRMDGYPRALKEYNAQPPGVPGLWCDWRPTPDGAAIFCPTRETFYQDALWLQFLIEHFLQPWGHTASGDVHWRVEGRAEHGQICVRNNRVMSIPFEGDESTEISEVYDAESGIPTQFTAGDALFLFDTETGAMHDCSFLRYGKSVEGELMVMVDERGKEQIYGGEDIADIVFQADYPCS